MSPACAIASLGSVRSIAAAALSKNARASNGVAGCGTSPRKSRARYNFSNSENRGFDIDGFLKEPETIFTHIGWIATETQLAIYALAIPRKNRPEDVP
jgi:hypothetical protein